MQHAYAYHSTDYVFISEVWKLCAPRVCLCECEWVMCIFIMYYMYDRVICFPARLPCDPFFKYNFFSLKYFRKNNCNSNLDFPNIEIHFLGVKSTQADAFECYTECTKIKISLKTALHDVIRTTHTNLRYP